jgi:hypothetical protein
MKWGKRDKERNNCCEKKRKEGKGKGRRMGLV